MDKEEKGFVYLVGAGPGEPSYITVRGMELLQKCDAVIYDRLASAELLLYTRPDCVKLYVGKKPGAHAMKQEEINQILVKEALKGQLVVRLKGGDPFVFGRGGEEIQELEKNGIGYEVIPGITSAVSVPMAAGIPVTHRGVSQSFHVITGHTADGVDDLTDNYEALAKTNGTLVFLMGLSHLPQITARLCREGMTQDTPVAVIEQGTTVFQRTVRGNLATICDIVQTEKMHSPVIIIVGAVAGLSMKLPVCKIGITGTLQFIEHMKDALEEHHEDKVNNQIVTYPYVEIQCIMDEQIKDTLMHLDDYQWIVFTSANGVRCFFQALQVFQVDRRRLGDKKFAVIGEGTAGILAEYGYYADFMPGSYYAETLGRELAEKIQGTGEKVLLARALHGSMKLSQELQKKGIVYTDIPVYQTKARREVVEQALEQMAYLDVITFASASGVRFLCEVMSKEDRTRIFDKVTALCIGKETALELEKYGIKHYKVARRATAQGLADLLYGKD